MLARDVSNYSLPLTEERLAGWRADGVGLVIIQCFPPGYAQTTQQDAQIAACDAAGMPWDGYIYDYLSDASWRDGALYRLGLRVTSGLMPRKLWLDEEDINPTPQWSPQMHVDAIAASLAAADEWCASYGLPRAGIYSAAWWWSRTGNTTAFMDRHWWIAEYDGIADASVYTPFVGVGEVRIKQYMGSQIDGTDLDVLSTAEVSEMTQPEPPPEYDAAWQAKKPIVVSTAGELLTIADQIMAEANRKGGPRAKQTRELSAAVRSRAEIILA